MKPSNWINYRESCLNQSIDSICDLLFYLPLKKFEDDYTQLETTELIKLMQLLTKYYQIEDSEIFKDERAYLINLAYKNVKVPDEMILIKESHFILSRNGFIWKLLHPTRIDNSGTFETVALISNLGVGIHEESVKLAFEISAEFRGKRIMKEFLKKYLRESQGVFEALISADNEASISLVQSVGFNLCSQKNGTLCFKYYGSGS